MAALQADAQVAGQHHVGGAAVHAAVECTNRHRARTGQRVGHLFKKGRAVPGLVKPTNVVTRTKHRLGLPGGVGREHQHAHAGIGLDQRQMGQQRREVAVFELVALGWAVEGDGGHAALDLQDGRTGLGKGAGHVEVFLNRKKEKASEDAFGSWLHRRIVGDQHL